MRNFLKKTILMTSLVLGLSSVSAAYQPAENTDIYVVMFRADWCAPCKVVEPRLEAALATLRDPKIEYINIDISGGNGDWNANTVFDKQIVPQYNMWMGVTGFAAIIDADTKETLGCINMTYNTDAMTLHLSNLKRLAQKNQSNFDLTCPEANSPV